MENVIDVRATSIILNNYIAGECPTLERSLCAFDRATHKFDPIGLVYDFDNNQLRLPKGLDIDYLERVLKRQSFHNTEYDPKDGISIRLVKYPRSNLQNDLIQFLIGEGEYTSNKNDTQLIGDAETGEGKTFCAIAAITYLRTRTIIIVNRTNIVKNWVDSIENYTDTDSKRILVLTSSKIEKVMNNPSMVAQYNVFVATHQTIKSMSLHHGWDYVTDIFKTLRVGLKIYDEAHKEFNTMLHIDAYTNTRRTFYLSATMERSSFQEDKVFQLAFKNVSKFNQYKLGYTDSKKHIVMIAYIFNSHPSVYQISNCKKFHGFNSRNYASYQVDDDSENFFGIVEGMVDKFTVKNNMRTLIITSLIAACDVIADELRKVYPDKNIGVYNSSIPKKEKQSVLDNSDIIISTSSSLGYAETIDNLRFVLNCEAFRSIITGKQVSGRLRKLPDGELCYYAELIDVGFKSINSQFKEREKKYKKMFKEIIYLEH